MKFVVKGTLGCLGITLYVAVLVLAHAVVLKSIWLWFVVPFGVMPLTIPHAVGLSGVVALFHHSPREKQDDTESTKTEKLVAALLQPFLRLAFVVSLGSLAHSFM